MSLNVTNPQRIFEMYGRYGCLMICYSHIAKVDALDALAMYKDLKAKDIIDEEFYIKDAEKLLTLLTGLKYSVIKTNKEDFYVDRQYVGKWFNSRTGHTHFVVMKNGKVDFDPLGDSTTVKEGVLVDIRVIKAL